ncbi:MAG: Fe-S cluster assembly protein SufD [Myxococcota bacterium]
MRDAFAALGGGLPTKKHERWRFTSLRALKELNFAPGADALSLTLPAGTTATKGAPEPHDAPVDFAALNAVASDGQTRVLRVEKSSADPILLTHTATGVHYPRLRIDVAKGQEALVIERHQGRGALTALAMDIALEDGAILRHVRVHEDAGRSISRVAVRAQRSSRYEQHAITFGGELMRLDLDIVLAGEGAECGLYGAYHGDESDHIDTHIRAVHRAPHCTSRQDYRGLVDGRATAVFDGQAIVERTAPFAEAHQQNRNLLLSERANVFTKPHLEIDHDEVIASHGATVGALDDASLFYLRSRGISEDVARALLTFAFVRAIIDGVPDAALAEELRATLRERIPGAADLPEVPTFEDAS